MPPRITLFLAAVCGGALSFGATASAPQRASILVEASTPGKPISPDLFGIFFEDLNYAADGGLYAEMIANRSFEYTSSEQAEWNELTGWTANARGGASGAVAIRTSKPLHPNNPHYISLEVKEPGEGYGVVNEGIDGLVLRAKESYELTFFAQQLFMGGAWSFGKNDIVGRPMPVTVRLESDKGELLAQSTIEIRGRDWVKHTLNLIPAKDSTKARLVILAQAQGGIAVDEISLFPENTFHQRKNGLRADLAQTIADLKPKFVRFPGGCLAHGDGINNFYRWKDTVGPVEERRGQRNLWGYHQSVGLGYFEFFQFCEDIGAQPLPVVPAGVSCQNTGFAPGFGQQCVPLADMPAYIQDVLDLVEWANGPADSRWGSVRAAAGHAKPFGLKYLGVGNEDSITPGFKERFKLLQDAIHARYPEIVVIGTVGPAPGGRDFDEGWTFARAEKVPVVDEHYYMPPQWFWENLQRYNRYDRGGPQVYVGEYAAHEPDRRNTLRTALAEAAACVGFEQNGDVVRLASYAPLLARCGHTQWTPDLIYFTGTDVYPSINYQVQRLVGVNGGDELLSSKVEGVPAGSRFAVSAVRDSKSGAVIVKVVNGDDRPVSADLNLGTLATGGRKMHVTVLSGPNADIANEDGKPSSASLVDEEQPASARFVREFPAYSFTVLRLQ